MKDCYINIQSWMVQKLKLTGNELIIYALIHGFSQDGKSNFFGSRKYISEQTGISVRQINDILQKLQNKNLITKRNVTSLYILDSDGKPVQIKSNGGANYFCIYYTNISRQDEVTLENNNSDSEEAEKVLVQEEEDSECENRTREREPSAEIAHGPSAEIAHNNIALNSRRESSFCDDYEKVILEQINYIFRTNPFDDSFVLKLTKLFVKHSISIDFVPNYFTFIKNKVDRQKPDSYTNYFYNVILSENCFLDFKIKNENKTEVEKNTEKYLTKCPICNSPAYSYSTCTNPDCNFNMTYISNKEKINFYKNIYKLSESQKNKLNQTLENFYIKNPVNFASRKKELTEIYKEYGIAYVD